MSETNITIKSGDSAELVLENIDLKELKLPPSFNSDDGDNIQAGGFCGGGCNGSTGLACGVDCRVK